ncbi:MAG: class 1 fructose-bisphosphatase [candidate division NC10 bacterium]
MNEPITLDEHVKRSGHAEAAELAIVITQLAVAGKIIARELARAALVGQLGTTGETNVQGEPVKKLDLWANGVVVRAMEETGLVTTLVSEEMAEPLRLTKTGAHGRYVVCFDPVDGSSNLDVNGIVGTIFSIRKGRETVQPGTAQVAAGYIMYGPATLLVLTTGDGVDGFTLGPTIGEFVRSHHQIRIPARGRVYSVNEGNSTKWEPGVRRYIEYLRAADVATGRPYTARYVGSLVADFHRTLLEGGIFLYPADATGGKPSGKLRLQYEAAPMAWLVEQAGGRATTGRERIMTIEPATPHQRVPLIIGSPEDVGLAEDFIAGRK